MACKWIDPSDVASLGEDLLASTSQQFLELSMNLRNFTVTGEDSYIYRSMNHVTISVFKLLFSKFKENKGLANCLNRFLAL